MPAPPTASHRSARDALICIGFCVLLLLGFEGESLRHSGDAMTPGWQRTMVLAVARPAGALSAASGLNGIKNHLVAWVRSGNTPSGAGGFSETGAARSTGQVAPVTPDAFDPRSLGIKPAPAPPLRTVLVTGDSMVQGLDAKVARAFASASSKVSVIRDAHIGTAISQPDILDWGSESLTQVHKDKPQAVVMFLGANEGFPISARGSQLKCCGLAWTTAYANRVRQMMNTYRQAGTARVYWLELPAPESPARQQISRAVNAAIVVAAEPYRAQVRVIDLASIFTPGGRYRASMLVGGQPTIVRQADGVHLNDAGASVALPVVLGALRNDFGAAVPQG
jgi:hypothetical protein